MTPDTVALHLLPLGRRLSVQPGTPLQDVLFAQGVEFPCGGRGRCKGCRIKVIEGQLPVTAEDRGLLTPDEIAAGWRLACRAQADQPLTIELAQWEAPILGDDSRFEFVPRQGLGVAIDLGTTTVVAQLIDLQTANVLAVRTALNAQARHGADIMSRIDFAMTAGGQPVLMRLVREQIGGLIEELLASQADDSAPLSHVVLVGNTAMHHLFCGIAVEPLSHYPFEPVDHGLKVFPAEQLGWKFAAEIRFLPCLGGFVGSDVLAGILATRLHESDAVQCLIDLGTNGEIVVGNRQRMLCASTAAGPAFEGARISMGMRAATGAISEVGWRDGQWHCRVLGNGPPRGICGSGLVDAVAAGLDAGRIQACGRFSEGASLLLAPPVALSQKDIRELQLAKGAIAAGLRLLLRQWGADANSLSRIHLAGAFGNYISRASARRIGLLNFPPERVEPAGNTALRGAKLALFGLAEGDGSYTALRKPIQHISLSADAQFQEVFVEEMQFPVSSTPGSEL